MNRYNEAMLYANMLFIIMLLEVNAEFRSSMILLLLIHQRPELCIVIRCTNYYRTKNNVCSLNDPIESQMI